MTEAQYLAFERTSALKHELLAGQVFAMTGASKAQNLISGSTYATLYNQLCGRPCNLLPGDTSLKRHHPAWQRLGVQTGEPWPTLPSSDTES